MKRAVIRLGIWWIFALLLTLPLLFEPASTLLGDPRIDVWNHAWGYDWVARHLMQGTLPFHTPYIGGPAGGTLWFIDTPGALLAQPVTLAGGPALGYNAVLLGRIAWSGFGAQQLAEHMWERDGGAGWIAGVAYATAPFLLAEVGNGISEVCATGWLPLTLWAGSRALDDGGMKRWAALGLMQGITTVTTFYYGLTSAILVGLLVLGVLLKRWRAGRRPDTQLLLGICIAGIVGLCLMGPHWMAFRISLDAPDALIRRSSDLNLALMAHNAVDPRIFFTPGPFQSVDLVAEYGEPFIHTGYLRWTVVLLAGAGLVARRRNSGWAALGLASLVMGMGPYLWWNGDWLTVGGRMVSLPFGWLRAVLPQLAITHPLRLSLGAQAIACALAGGGAAWLAGRWEGRRRVALATALGAVAMAEGLFGSSAAFPLPRADATVPAVYGDAPEGMVLDLPAEVGTTMATSRYFWMQTLHGRAIPWTPDARLGSVRDTETFHGLVSPADPTRPGPEIPHRPDQRALRHILETYGMIVVHTDLEEAAGMATSYVDVLSPILGTPVWDGPRAVWRLP
ncbi:MAG: hypothetical protein VX265_10540 [Myxococcota bacterium]|nr:hypothetical protein [Myxococcota bacterium]